jgi:hypothetical protein
MNPLRLLADTSPHAHKGCSPDDAHGEVLVSQHEWEGIEAAFREAKRRRCPGAKDEHEGRSPTSETQAAPVLVEVEDLEDVAGPALPRTRMARHRRWGLKVSAQTSLTFLARRYIFGVFWYGRSQLTSTRSSSHPR